MESKVYANDEERLAAHHARRGVKPRRQCKGCYTRYSAESGEITRHHLIPKASEGALRGRGVKIATIALCFKCHTLVHTVWGEGHKFTGPTDEMSLLTWLYSEVLDRRLTNAGSEVS